MAEKDIFKKVRELEIATRGLVNQVFSGEYHSVFKGRGMEFSEVREYQYGDDIRNIDWNVTARFGHPFIKVFEEERELTVILVVDLSGSQNFGSSGKTKKQIAAELSAILAFSALKNNDKVGCILFTDTIEKFIPPRKKKGHILRIIKEILAFEPERTGTGIKQALEFLSSTIKKRSIVFLISDFLDDGYDQILKIIGRKHDLVGISLADEREYKMPSVGLINFIDPESGKQITLDTSDKQFQKQLNKKLSAQLEARNKLFAVSKLDNVALNIPRNDDDFNYLKPLIRFFKQRAARW
ncbi:MAG: DUF58 domain-containing protein [Ignavibacteriales bacterium]|nr:DUF58 domain-containing protein [Ignavibacteriales bacterium]